MERIRDFWMSVTRRFSLRSVIGGAIEKSHELKDPRESKRSLVCKIKSESVRLSAFSF